jgi:hypothetical protein
LPALDAILNAVEVRVLGSLIEKRITTPEYYPLTLNALVNACNQLTNREPVVQYDDKTVARALEDLRDKKFVWLVSQAGARVPKYEERLVESLSLTEQETAVLCMLMLRGPQTPGEIRSRTGRMYEFKELGEVELTLQALLEAAPRALAARLPRIPGTKEARFAHLLAGEVAIDQAMESSPRLDRATVEVRAENERITALEERVGVLREEIAALRQAFVDFRKQFE